MRYFILFIIFCISTPIAMATTISFYDAPKADAKVIGTVDSSTGVITIFAPKEGDWVKIADPRNGNVGWVKKTDMDQLHVRVNTMQMDNGNQGYQVMQYGNMQAQDPAEWSRTIKKMQEQQIQIQKDMQKMMQDMLQTSPMGGEKTAPAKP